MARQNPERRTVGKNRTEDASKRVRKEKVAVAGPHTEETTRKHHKAIFAVESPGPSEKRQAKNNMEEVHGGGYEKRRIQLGRAPEICPGQRWVEGCHLWPIP